MIQSFVTTQEQEMMLQDYLKGRLKLKKWSLFKGRSRERLM